MENIIPNLIRMSRVSYENNIDLEDLLFMTIAHNKLIKIKDSLKIIRCTADTTCHNIFGEYCIKYNNPLRDLSREISILFDFNYDNPGYKDIYDKINNFIDYVREHIDVCFEHFGRSWNPRTQFSYEIYYDTITLLENKINEKYLNALNKKGLIMNSKQTKTSYLYQLSLSDGSSVIERTDGLFFQSPNGDRHLINSAVLVKIEEKEVEESVQPEDSQKDSDQREISIKLVDDNYKKLENKVFKRKKRK